MTKVTKLQLDLPTRSVRRSLEFYTEALLFTKVFDFPESCTVALDSFYLTLRSAEKERAQSFRQSGFSFCLRLDDISNYYERVKTAGKARFEQELELMMPGVLQFSVIDINGYRIGFAMP